jgi:hypothetical protein
MFSLHEFYCSISITEIEIKNILILMLELFVGVRSIYLFKLFIYYKQIQNRKI